MAVSELCSRLDAPLKREEESANQKRATVRGKELTLTNTLQLTAIVELLEERGIMTQSDVLKRMKEVRDRKRVS
jgi:hypothetical protein